MNTFIECVSSEKNFDARSPANTLKYLTHIRMTYRSMEYEQRI